MASSARKTLGCPASTATTHGAARRTNAVNAGCADIGASARVTLKARGHAPLGCKSTRSALYALYATLKRWGLEMERVLELAARTRQACILFWCGIPACIACFARSCARSSCLTVTARFTCCGFISLNDCTESARRTSLPFASKGTPLLILVLTWTTSDAGSLANAGLKFAFDAQPASGLHSL